MMRTRTWVIAIVAAAVAAVILLGWLRYRPTPAPAPRPGVPKVAPGPRTVPPRPQPTTPARPEIIPDYAPLREKLRAYLATRPAKYTLYFKDLRSGAEFGIDEGYVIHAASTIKVPIVLYLNTLVSRKQASFDTRVAYRAAEHYQTGAGILHMQAVEGETYSLRVLANLAITISDNVATAMLIDYLGLENIKDFMRGLGGKVVFPEGRRFTTAHDMGLYVQAVLDFAKKEPALGERLLDDMANSIYDVGLSGELPATVKVPHKEGDIEGVADDVGVVYAARPFIFSVLSEGQVDPIAGFTEIAHLTRLAYDYQNGLTRQ